MSCPYNYGVVARQFSTPVILRSSSTSTLVTVSRHSFRAYTHHAK
jgi:hypothetical protein